MLRGARYTHTLKPALDHGAAALALLAGLVPGLIVAALIRLDSRGPVFFRQQRVGRNGRPFRIWKFRTMADGSEHAGSGWRVEKADPRVTRVGRVLRRFSLDELPQLINVLCGEMSLVGPRPGLPVQAAAYDENERERLMVRPGITGWAQVNGRNAIDWGARIELDREYIRNIGLALDLRVLLLSVAVVLRGDDQVAAGDYFVPRSRGERRSRASPRDG